MATAGEKGHQGNQVSGPQGATPRYKQLASKLIKNSGELKEFLAAIMEALALDQIPHATFLALVKNAAVQANLLKAEWWGGGNLPLYAKLANAKAAQAKKALQAAEKKAKKAKKKV